MRRFIDDSQGGRRLLFGLIAIAVLVVIDVVLVALAMRAHDTPPDAAAPPIVSSSAPTTQGATPSATAEEESSSRTRMIAAIDGSAAWRAVAGSCLEPGTFEITSDGGATWSPAGLALGATVLALEPRADGQRGLVVVADEQCGPVVHRTFTAGAGWEPSPVQEAGSYVTDQGQLVLAGVAIDAPCDAPSAAVATGDGVVLCADEALARTSGGDWVSVAQGVTAIGPADSGVALVLEGSTDCDGLAAGVVVAGAVQTVCSGASAGAEVAVSAVGGQVWVWADETVEILSL
ncbi:hypothetical protein SAMN04487783_0450 [Agrococcus baldri]|uniref:Uncharacterized protein n=1 Tax=Agrococcus baldri TaxID=153730 RepID=A0AA94HKH5_9MICO|nr:hypothetical protein [Agrococcus baldri]SFS00402.1 hypothetical protein SAMN04487783_0450 [Agrococcus baldri]